ncbi:MAG: hypothetical protein PWQ55_1853 [Chloroflexota bacterium]|nr:hypothetical protein [Chloroflexota bacterium]
MELLIFDMDGVLLEPLGYHRALQETVRLAGDACGFEDVRLSAAQIARFEALGISSEWHSSALCLAWMTLQREFAPNSCTPDWERLVVAFERQPQADAPIRRGMTALVQIAQEENVDANCAVAIMENCESIAVSSTFNWFQELVLGSELFERIYGKPGCLQTDSYLRRYDRRLLELAWAQRVVDWTSQPDCGASIMTSRPSDGPQGYAQEPDGKLGAELVGLGALPLVGNGEMRWLAEQLDATVAEVKKPAAAHALAALLAADGWPLERSLELLADGLAALRREALAELDGSRVTVVEDTISGLLAVSAAAELLAEMDVHISVRNMGVATDVAKRAALEGMGATVYADVNLALEDVLTTDKHG